MQGCQEDFWGPGQGFEIRPLQVFTFVNLFRTDFNVDILVLAKLSN